jgi:Pentapeptide repeats (9 copies)
VSAIKAQFDGATFHGTAGFHQATFQNAWFDRASFTGQAWFRAVTFQRDAQFLRATFHGVAWFNGATFQGDAWFGEASFPGTAWFDHVTFRGKNAFNGVTFHRGARFFKANFQDQANFDKTIFAGEPWFGEATFQGFAWFDGATFQGRAWFGQATFQDDVLFREATFQGDAQFGEATLTGDTGLGVAGAEVLHLDDLQLEAGLLGDQVPGEGGLPALVQDGLLDPFRTPIGLGSAGPNEAVSGSQLGDGGLEAGRAELRGVIAHDPLELPAASGQVGGHRAGQGAGPGRRRVTPGGLEGGPGGGRGDIDSGVLPHGALGPAEPADAETVQLDQLPRMVDVQVPLLRQCWPRRFGRGGVAGNQPIASGAGGEAVAAQHSPHPIG